MPKDILTFSQYGADNAAFRAKVLAVHNAFLAMGLVEQVEGSPINPATVNRPTAINQIAGKKIYKFDDAFQATKPVFIEVSFGTVVAVSNAMSGGDNWGIFQLFFRVGTATDGNLNIADNGKRTALRALSYVVHNNTANTSNVVTNTVAQADQANEHLITGDVDRVALVMGQNSNQIIVEDCWKGLYSIADNQPFHNVCRSSMMLVERSRDAAGNPTNDGIVVMSMGSHLPAQGNTYKAYSAYVPFDRPFQYHHDNINCVYMGTSARNSTLSGLTLGSIPLIPMEGSIPHNPPISLVGYLANDFSWGGTPTEIEVYETLRDYRPIPSIMPVAAGMQYPNSRLAMLWEA